MDKAALQTYELYLALDLAGLDQKWQGEIPWDDMGYKNLRETRLNRKPIPIWGTLNSVLYLMFFFYK